MRTARRRRRRLGGPRARLAGLLLLVVVVVVAAIEALSGSGGIQGRPFESMFQDDQMLVDNPSTPSVIQTLDTLKALGVDRLRVTVQWKQVAPNANVRLMPRGFNGADPADYPQTAASGWAAYDRIDLLAAEKGIAVDFDVSDPAPLWATTNYPPADVSPAVYAPSAREFGQFVEAVGRRYSGHYKIVVTPGKPKVALPRVSFWTIWNEPNQPGWLAPQFRVTGAGAATMLSPALDREYVDAAWTALHASGHGKDRILIGELAPEGCPPGGGNAVCGVYTRAERPITPIPFLQALYCVNGSYQRLTSAAASAVGCPPSGSAAAFRAGNPALFDASAFTHHPYAFATAPAVPLPEPSFVPLSNLVRLETALDHAFAAYGSQRKIPLYLDEYGYETNPPNPIPGRGQSLRHQAAWIDQAEYMAWKDPRVEGLSQFLLVDAAPDPTFPKGSQGYWSTFQTGLEFLGGQPKPSLAAYRLPIFLPSTSGGGPVLVWGMLRPARNGTTQHAAIQWRAPGRRFHTVTEITTSNRDGVFETPVSVPRRGAIRIGWTAPGGRRYYSRAASVSKG
ncbi:MAG TPA: hypothetical protein VG223_11605 [Solirubrobacteraceae bacterium]|nr:hypothetical protein [Solirubrobacteraceae bacterium]